MRKGIMHSFTKTVLALTVLLWAGAGTVRAQYSILYDKKTEKEAERPRISVRTPSVINTDAQYESLVKARKRQQRRERNYLELGSSLTVNQVSFDNWATEASNSLNGRLEVNFKHTYTDDKLNLESTFYTVYQLGTVDKQFRKLDDRFELNFKANYQMHKNWYYSGSVNFKSQYSNGYKYPVDTLISRFMAPAYLILSLGLNYMPENGNFSLTLAPISGKMTFVLDKTLSRYGKFGVDPGKKVKSELGAYLRATWEQPFFNKICKYRTVFTGFYNYKDTPNLGWENWLDVKLIRLFTFKIYCHVIYDRLADTPRSSPWQFNENIGFGIAYTFRNKPKP